MSKVAFLTVSLALASVVQAQFPDSVLESAKVDPSMSEQMRMFNDRTERMLRANPLPKLSEEGRLLSGVVSVRLSGGTRLDMLMSFAPSGKETKLKEGDVSAFRELESAFREALQLEVLHQNISAEKLKSYETRLAFNKSVVERLLVDVARTRAQKKKELPNIFTPDLEDLVNVEFRVFRVR